MNESPETIQLLGENRSSKTFDIGLDNDFLYLILKAKATKAKINKLDYIKLKSFCTAKETINKMKYFSPIGKIFANLISDKGLVSKIYKKFIQLNSKKKSN